MKDHQASVICFGETLWDIFPSGKTAGGAPMNVALNLHKLGIDVKMISRMGDDKLGEELYTYLKSNGVDTSLIQQDKQHATGVVQVKLDNQKNATYDIIFPSAWDFIDCNPEIDNVIDKSCHLVFGSLACRHENSYQTLVKILKKAKHRVFDVNLRFPYYTWDLIETLLHEADSVKLNDQELMIISDWMDCKDMNTDSVCRKLMRDYKIDQLILTLGEKGAMVFYKDKIFTHHGFKVEAVDTVGSGDAFLAAFLACQIKGKDIAESLEFACAAGSYVVTQQGANPLYEEKQVREFLSKTKFT